MLNASNRNSGNHVAGPDVCQTPSPAGPIPIPYVNLAQTSQAVGFSTTVKVEGGNALSQAASIPSTSGDEAGSAHPVFRQEARYTMGNPKVRIEQMPAITLGSITSGNSMNAAIGAVVAPSAVTVYFTDQGLGVGSVGLDEVRALQRVATDDHAIRVATLEDRIALVRIERFSEDAARLFEVSLSRLREEPLVFILDLRGTPGGSLEGALRFCERFLSRGRLIASIAEAGETSARCSGEVAPRMAPLIVLVDERTASAAELVAGSLAMNDRAVVVGARTYGKCTLERVDAHGRYVTVGTWSVDREESFEGVVPHVTSAEPLLVGLEIARAFSAELTSG